MPRHRRRFFPGLSLHVVQRGNNRSDIFRSDDDRQVFLWALRNASGRFRLEVHAYVLMTNHFHLIATPVGESTLAHAMQFVGRHYVPYFNRRHSRTGGLFHEGLGATDAERQAAWRTACGTPLSDEQIWEVRRPSTKLSRSVPGSDPGLTLPHEVG